MEQTFEANAIGPITSRFEDVSGYGLVNAAAAVANAIRQSSFAKVADLGGNLWGLDMVNAPEVWAKGYTGQNVTVAVLDTGVDSNHSDLAGNIWTNKGEIAGDGIDNDLNGFIDDIRGWDFVYNDNGPRDVDGHGTHIAGTISGLNDGVGITGVAYNAKIMPVKVLNNKGSGSKSNIAAGIRYATDNGADVINLSLGGSSPSLTLRNSLQYAQDRGVVIVMASGNEGASIPAYPARYATDLGISVGAVDRSSQIPSFSNAAGSDPNINYVLAPGKSIYSTLTGGGYGLKSGTSMATPHVAGVVALMLSANSRLTPSQVQRILINSATQITQSLALLATNLNYDPPVGQEVALATNLSYLSNNNAQTVTEGSLTQNLSNNLPQNDILTSDSFGSQTRWDLEIAISMKNNTFNDLFPMEIKA